MGPCFQAAILLLLEKNVSQPAPVTTRDLLSPPLPTQLQDHLLNDKLGHFLLKKLPELVLPPILKHNG